MHDTSNFRALFSLILIDTAALSLSKPTSIIVFRHLVYTEVNTVIHPMELRATSTCAKSVKLSWRYSCVTVCTTGKSSIII